MEGAETLSSALLSQPGDSDRDRGQGRGAEGWSCSAPALLGVSPAGRGAEGTGLGVPVCPRGLCRGSVCLPGGVRVSLGSV